MSVPSSSANSARMSRSGSGWLEQMSAVSRTRLASRVFMIVVKSSAASRRGGRARPGTRRVRQGLPAAVACTLGCGHVSIGLAERFGRASRRRAGPFASRAGIAPIVATRGRRRVRSSAGPAGDDAQVPGVSEVCRRRAIRSASGSPERGCANASRAACSAWRCMPSAGRAAVERVADQRMAARREVDADLVGAAGVQRAAQRARSRRSRASARRRCAPACPTPTTAMRDARPSGRGRSARRSSSAPCAARRARARGSGAGPRARRSRAPARSPRQRPADDHQARRCPCRAGARCRRAAAPRRRGRARAGR